MLSFMWFAIIYFEVCRLQHGQLLPPSNHMDDPSVHPYSSLFMRSKVAIDINSSELAKKICCQYLTTSL